VAHALVRAASTLVSTHDVPLRHGFECKSISAPILGNGRQQMDGPIENRPQVENLPH
jgi:hypothetical protein